jgi:uncharacterized peroxidase-related enzyme
MPACSSRTLRQAIYPGSGAKTITSQVIESPTAFYDTTGKHIDENYRNRKEQCMQELKKEQSIRFTIHSIESAPEDSKPILTKLKSEVGFVPNLAAAMAESPSLLEAFTTLRAINGRSSFTPVERETIALAVSFDNNCTYCMAAHSTFAKMNGISDEALNSLRSGNSPADSRLQALSNFTRQIVRKKGYVSEEDIRAFLDSGFTQSQILDVFVVMSMTTLANYAHNVAHTPVDEAFRPQAWAAPA